MGEHTLKSVEGGWADPPSRPPPPPVKKMSIALLLFLADGFLKEEKNLYLSYATCIYLHFANTYHIFI